MLHKLQAIIRGDRTAIVSRSFNLLGCRSQRKVNAFVETFGN